MHFNTRSELAGKHAFLSPSAYHWVNYDDHKLESRFHTFKAAKRGSDLHDLAHEAIRLGIRLDGSHEALAAYVAHGIEFGMTCEQPLYYSENCFGHADTICFDGLLLRIHDLKTGITKVSERQLELYAAIFCLEYDIDPFSITFELRIYQRDQLLTFEPPSDLIHDLMKRIVYANDYVESLKEV